MPEQYRRLVTKEMLAARARAQAILANPPFGPDDIDISWMAGLPKGGPGTDSTKKMRAERDRFIILCLSEGWTQEDIAKHMGVRIDALRMIVLGIKDRYKARTVAHLVSIALRDKVIL